MTAYQDDDDLQTGRLSAALWRRMLAHAHPYRRAFFSLSFAGMVIAFCDVLLPRVTGGVIDVTTAGQTERLPLYALDYLGLVALLASMVSLFIVMAGVASTGLAYDLRRTGFAKLPSARRSRNGLPWPCGPAPPNANPRTVDVPPTK